MKNLNEYINVNEARNYPYRISVMNGISATVTLDNPKDADEFDKWLEEQIDNTIRFADGGPNDIELPE